jgi:hypothetical protein
MLGIGGMPMPPPPPIAGMLGMPMLPPIGGMLGIPMAGIIGGIGIIGSTSTGEASSGPIEMKTWRNLKFDFYQ